MTDTKRSPLPPLEELAEAVSILIAIGIHPQKDQRKELEKVLQNAGSLRDFFPVANGPCERDAIINTHLGAGGVITPGRFQDPEGEKSW